MKLSDKERLEAAESQLKEDMRIKESLTEPIGDNCPTYQQMRGRHFCHECIQECWIIDGGAR
jgi:hypothetical protein